MPSERHEELVDRLAEKGWSRGTGWRDAFRAAVAEEPFRGEEGATVLDMAYALARRVVNPDAYRLKVEGGAEGWLHPVLVVEIAEVVVTSDLSSDVFAAYEDFWWACDSTDTVHFRLYVLNRYGEMRCILDEDPEPLFGVPA